MRSKILVPGTFDLLHYGHMRFLQLCSVWGHVTVALATDDHAAYSKRKPLMSYDERKESLLHLPYVQQVTAKAWARLWPIIYAVDADCVAYGSDWDEQEWLELNQLSKRGLQEQDITLLRVPNPLVISTTALIARAALNERL